MFGIGGSEFILIGLFALLIFGPDKIPQMARTVGKFMREFNKYKETMESTIRAEVYREGWQTEGKPSTAPAATAPEPEPPAATGAVWAADEDDEEDEGE